MSNLDFGFDSLRDSQESANELLRSPHAKLEIASHGHEDLAQDLSESSLKMADSCAAAKDLLLTAKSHLQDLHTAFRRATSTGAPRHLESHRLPRKQLKKAILKRLDSLKNASVSGDSSPPGDRRLEAVIDMLADVRSTMLLVVGSLLTLIVVPAPDAISGSGRKDPIFRMRLRRVDSLRVWEVCEAVEEWAAAAKRVESAEGVVEEMAEELERIFRRLIRTRASLLNILTT